MTRVNDAHENLRDGVVDLIDDVERGYLGDVPSPLAQRLRQLLVRDTKDRRTHRGVG